MQGWRSAGSSKLGKQRPGEKSGKSILDKGTASASESQHQSTWPSAETGSPRPGQDGNMGTMTGEEDKKGRRLPLNGQQGGAGKGQEGRRRSIDQNEI